MSQNLPSHYVQQFATNIQLLLQQPDSRFRSAVMQGNHYGEQASPVDQIGAVNMQPVVGRFAPIGRVDAAVDRRWVSPSDYDLNQLIDSFDKLRLLTDPQSVYTQNAVQAANRQLDDLIIAAFFGTAKTGKTGTTSTVFDTTYQIAADAGATGEVGLTVYKLRQAKKGLMANEVAKIDPLFIGVTATQHDNMLAEVQVTSTDFNDRPVLVNGDIDRFLGINFIHSERLVLVSTDNRQVPVWAKSGMHLGLWNDMQTDIDRRKDLSGHPWQAYLKLTAGATRLEEKKVFKILCDE